MTAPSFADQAVSAAEVARDAFTAGDQVTGIAAIRLAAQLLQLARLQERVAQTDASHRGESNG